jgi:hypothetical protein
MQAPNILSERGHRLLNIKKLKLGDIDQHQLLYKIFFPILLQNTSSILLFPPEASNIVNHGFIKYFLRSGNLDTIDEVKGFLHSYILRACMTFNKRPDNKCLDGEQLLLYILSDKVRQGARRGDLYEDLRILGPGCLPMIKQVFSSTYNKRFTMEILAKILGKPLETIEKLHLMGCQMLHLILSLEPSFNIDL